MISNIVDEKLKIKLCNQYRPYCMEYITCSISRCVKLLSFLFSKSSKCNCSRLDPLVQDRKSTRPCDDQILTRFCMSAFDRNSNSDPISTGINSFLIFCIWNCPTHFLDFCFQCRIFIELIPIVSFCWFLIHAACRSCCSGLVEVGISNSFHSDL